MLSLPWGLAGTVPKGWATGASAGGPWSLGIAEVCPHLVQDQVGLIPCCHQPMQCRWVLGTCGSSPAGCVSMPGSPTEMGTSVATTWPPLVLFGSVASPLCPSCWAQPELLPARQHPPLLHPAPMCGLQHGQAGAGGRYQGAGRLGGDPMTLSHDLPPHPSPLRAALMGLSLRRS